MTAREFGINNSEVVVLLHGGGLGWWNFTDEIELLKPRFHVVVPALDGNAGSEADFISIEENADRIINYIDEKFGGQVLMIGGLSLGGQVLLEMLSRRRNICKFALIESALALPMPLTCRPIKPVIWLSYGLIGKKWFSRLQLKSLNIRGDLFDAYFRDTCAISRENYVRILQSNFSYRVKPDLSRCHAKVLIFVGGKERPIMKKSAKLINDLIPNSELILIKNYHHGELSLNYADKYVEYMMKLMN